MSEASMEPQPPGGLRVTDLGKPPGYTQGCGMLELELFGAQVLSFRKPQPPRAKRETPHVPWHRAVAWE